LSPAGDINAQILGELKGLRTELADIRAAVSGTLKDPGMGEQLREAKADRQRLWEEIADVRVHLGQIEERVEAREQAPGRFVLRWADAVGLGLVITASVALGGLVWAQLHPFPLTIQETAHAAGVPHPHH
jgi:predicted trehalose synthase